MWQLWTLRQCNAPNFGGEEFWWECEFRNSVTGQTSFATGRTSTEARLEALSRIDTATPDDGIPF